MKRLIALFGLMALTTGAFAAAEIGQPAPDFTGTDINGKTVKLSPTLASVDSGEGEQKVVGKENEIKEGSSHGQDAVKITGTSAAGAPAGRRPRR